MNMLVKVHIEISKALCVHSIKSVASLSLRLVVLSTIVATSFTQFYFVVQGFGLRWQPMPLVTPDRIFSLSYTVCIVQQCVSRHKVAECLCVPASIRINCVRNFILLLLLFAFLVKLLHSFVVVDFYTLYTLISLL